MTGAASERVAQARNPYQRETDWHGLYAGSTSRDDHLFTPASVAHPAKMSLPLLRRILAQMTEWGWLAPGACVVDPFGGRGTTAAVWCAMDARNRAVTIEVEPHFAAMQEANREHARRKLGRPLRWVILQGDARNADGHLARRPGFMEANRCSPPYENSIHAGSGEGLKRENFADPKRVGRLANSQARPCDYGVAGVTSPPYGDSMHGRQSIDPAKARRPDVFTSSGNRAAAGFFAGAYGGTKGQIGNLPDAAITSPPYGQGTIGKANVERLRALTKDPTSSLAGRDPNGAWFRAMENGYAPGPGNIDLLPDAALTSPSYERAFHGESGIDPEKLADPNQAGATAQFRQPSGNGGYSAVTSPPYEASLGSDDPDKRGGLFRDPKRRNDRTLTSSYAGVTSPPYADMAVAPQGADGGEWNAAYREFQRTGDRERFQQQTRKAAREAGYGAVTSPPHETQGPKADGHHAVTSDEGLVRCKRDYATTGAGAQIGATQGDTYESACLAVYSALARAGVRYLAVVTKNPTRGGKLRRLDQTTARLLRAAGYRIRGWRRAWLFETEAQRTGREGQGGLFDDLAPSGRLTGRLSFFKRLSIGKGAPAAQWEDVFFAELAID